MPFSWENNKKKSEIKLLYRNKILVKTNPDFRMAHPELAKESETGNTDVEIKKFTNKQIARRIKYAQVPKPSLIVKRLNRVA